MIIIYMEDDTTRIHRNMRPKERKAKLILPNEIYQKQLNRENYGSKLIRFVFCF